MSNILVTKKAREKLAKARAGISNLSIIEGIALGDGGVDQNGIPNELSFLDKNLKHELIRKPYNKKTEISDTSYRYSISLSENELEGCDINEMGLYDSDGDILIIVTFSSKKKDGHIEMDFEIEDSF